MSKMTNDPTDQDQSIILAIRYRPAGETAWCYSVAPHREMVQAIQDECGEWDIEAVILTPEQWHVMPEFEEW